MNIVKVIRRGAKNSRVQLDNGSIILVPTASLSEEKKQDTLSVIRDMYAKFNARYFNNELPADILISMNSRKSSLGFFRAPRIFTTDVRKTELQFAVQIKDVPESAFVDTVLHEMIHVWQYFVVKVRDVHGPYFKAKADEINRDGHKISRCYDACQYATSDVYVIHTVTSRRQGLQIVATKPLSVKRNQTVYKVPKSYVDGIRSFQSLLSATHLHGVKC